MKKINALICQSEKTEEPKDKGPEDKGPKGEPPKDEAPGNPSGSDTFEVLKPDENKGKLLLDATCAPADIRYPTDLFLLNEAREKTEKTIDTLYNQDLGLDKKPRTYRKRARKDYLKIAKQRKPHAKSIRKAIGKQLGYLRRNLNTIDFLLRCDGYGNLSARQSSELETIRTLYAQQLEMYQTKTHRIDDRIVSISQPHVRPIVRGKAKAGLNLGLKWPSAW